MQAAGMKAVGIVVVVGVAGVEAVGVVADCGVHA